MSKVRATPLARAQATAHRLLAQELLKRYDRVSADWSALNDEQGDDGNVSATEAERYSVALELLAHDFATVVRAMLDDNNKEAGQ